MKKIFSILLVGFLSFVHVSVLAQDLNGFKSIYVIEPTYEDGRTDIWGIAPIVRDVFQKKGFSIVTPQMMQNPNFQEELFSMLRCEIFHTQDNWTGATVVLTFRDFNGNVVYKSSGGCGLAMNVQGWFEKATKRALREVSLMRYKYDPDKTPKPQIPDVEMTDWTEETIRAYLDENKSLDNIEGIYKSIGSETLGYYRLGIIKEGYKFKVVVLETDQKLWKVGEVKAILEPASLNVYSITWYMGMKQRVEVFGQLDSRGILDVDFSSVNSSTSRFLKVYPLSQDTSLPGGTMTKKSPSDIKNKQAKASGTGFAITKDGFIATNAHVIDGNNGVTVDVLNLDGTNSRYIADVIVKDAANDVAVIKIVDSEFVPFKEIPYTIETLANVGADVFTIGFPLNSVMGSNYKVSNGIISSKTGLNDDVREYQITVPIQPGNSGGPLFNKDGNVVGITTARLNGDAIGTHVENVNYAVKSLYLLNAINSISGIDELPDKSSLMGKTMEEQINILKNFIVLVKIY